MSDSPLLPISRTNSREWINEHDPISYGFQRSATMSLLQLYIPIELSNVTIAELGILEVVEFIDMNPTQSLLKRTFTNELKKCQELSRIIRYFEGELARVLPEGEQVLPKTNSMYRFFNSTREFDDMERNLKERESKLKIITSGIEQLERKMTKISLRQAILREMRNVIHDESEYNDIDESNIQLTSQSFSQNGLVAGCIAVEKYFLLERILWKMMHGNLIIRTSEMADFPSQTFLVIYVHGIRMRERIKTACVSMGALMIDSVEIGALFDERINDLSTQLLQMNHVMENSQSMQRAELKYIESHINVWKGCIQREELIYSALNLFKPDAGNRYLVGNAWCPSKDLSLVVAMLERITYQANTNMGPFVTELPIKGSSPPTFIPTNKFTIGFQDLMDAYGVATYKELNPAAFSIITFPFLFAVMFGDIGHGFIITIVAMWMCLKEVNISKSSAPILNNEIFLMAFNGRYILLLMGFFSIFTGLIYNDAFSRPLHLFHSAWSYTSGIPKQSGVYPFGIDWAWLHSPSALSFLNSYKMKQSILFGLMHMYFGIFLAAANHWHSGKRMNILYENIPQALFLSSIFGYLGFLILYKWTVPSENHPSLLTVLIDMVLNPLHLRKKDQLFSHQKEIQIILLIVAVICVFWMLLAKPIAHYYSQKRSDYIQLANFSQELNVDVSQPPANPEVFLNQSIHTIEFVLGSISNTASYLRLWALSLAHSQLSEVLWNMLIKHSHLSWLPIRICMYLLWTILTLFIMVVLEGLSAFLHSLRLHWVEFNSKFFTGDGRKFTPFSFSSPKQ